MHRYALALMLAFAAAVLPPLSSGCGGALLPAIATAVAVADKALDWLDTIERHVLPQVDRFAALHPERAAAVRGALSIARERAENLSACGKTKTAAACEPLRKDLLEAMRFVVQKTQPLGVRTEGPGAPEPILGARADGTLGVPTPEEVVRGEPAPAGAPQ